MTDAAAHGHEHGGHEHSGHEHGGHEHGRHGGPHMPSAEGTSPGAMWDERYQSMTWPSNPDPILVELASPLKPGKALDLACGPGRNGIWLAKSGWDVTGVDASEVGLAQATERAEDGGVAIRCVHADLHTYQPEPQSYDLVVVANLHSAPEERAEMLEKAASALAPGGWLFVIGHHISCLGHDGPPDPDRLYTAERLRAAMPPWLEIDRVEERARPHDADETKPDLAVVAWARRPPAGS